MPGQAVYLGHGGDNCHDNFVTNGFFGIVLARFQSLAYVIFEFWMVQQEVHSILQKIRKIALYMNVHKGPKL